jgi:hypothetical protein
MQLARGGVGCSKVDGAPWAEDAHDRSRPVEEIVARDDLVGRDCVNDW